MSHPNEDNFSKEIGVKSNRKLTWEERYALNYMKGFRIGSIVEARKILVRILHMKGKEQGHAPCRETLHKINREIDIPWLDEVIITVCDDRLSVEDFELYYDRLFLVADKSKSSIWQGDFDKLPLHGIAGVGE
jgi:hypothetical protein